MKSLDIRTRKNFPWVLIMALLFAVLLIALFQDPLAYLQELFSGSNLLISSITYTFVLAISVVFSPFTIAPAVPFVAKILGPEITFLLTLIGWLVGASIAFFIARFGKELLISKFYPLGKVIQNQYRLHQKPGFVTLLQTRLFASVDNFSYFLGLETRTSYVRFFWITLTGSVPAAFIFSFSAEAIADGDVITLFALFFAVSLIGLAYLSHRGLGILEAPARVHTKKESFIAGEILAVASLLLFFEQRNKKFKIYRDEDLSKIIEKKESKNKRNKEIYICDSHRTPVESKNIFGAVDAGVRGNNIPYGVFGLVWKKYGTAVCESEIVAKIIEQELVWGIDAEDNDITHGDAGGIYIEQWSLSEILEHNFVDKELTQLSKEENYQSFMKAVYFARDFLKRAITKEQSIHRQKQESIKSEV